MGLIRAVIGFFVAIVLTVFAVFNRHEVEVFIGPSLPSFELPFYMIPLGFMAAGFLFGGFFVWLNGADVRRIKRKQTKTIKALEKELGGLDFKSTHSALRPPSDFFPVLPGRKKSVI